MTGSTDRPELGTRLELQDVTAGYGSSLVLRDVSLVAPSGSVTALIGPNGAGKTTLLRVAAGLLAPLEGQVRLGEEEITNVAPDGRARRGLCLIPEGRGIFPTLTVRENLLLHAKPGGEAEGLERAVGAFPKLGDRLGQTAGTLSGGEQQMVALSRAWTANASVVMVDEASMGLAPIVVEDIFSSLADLARSGVSLLIVEQYVHRALAMSDYVYVLEQGRLAFCGEPGEIADGQVFEMYLGR